MDSFNFNLPKAKIDAICIVTKTQDQVAAAYMTYCLSKQAGLNIGYAYSELEIPEADTYILPSIYGNEIMDKNKLLMIKERVRNGASLYVSIDTGIIPQFQELFGMKVVDSGYFNENLVLELNDKQIPFSRSLRYHLAPVGAEVIAKDSLGLPAISKYAYGNGTVYLVNFPLETMLTNFNDAFEGAHHEIYKTLFADKIDTHEVVTNNKYIGITLHPATDGSIYCVAINYSAQEQKFNMILKNQYKIHKVYYGNTDVLNPFDAVIFKIKQ